MTLEEWKVRFVTYQTQSDVTWLLSSNNKLRGLAGYNGPTDPIPPLVGARCPITAEFDMHIGQIQRCAYRLGLSQEAIRTICHAGDNMKNHNEELRAWLLRVCGVKEREAAWTSRNGR